MTGAARPPCPNKKVASRRLDVERTARWRLASSSFGVRRASVRHAEQVLACLREAFQPFRESYTAKAYRNTVLSRRSLAQRMATMTVLIAVDADGCVVGTVACQKQSRGHGHLRGMAVRPRWQGKGVADELLHAAEQELHRLRCTRVTLDTTAPLRRAMRFYERHGFRRTGHVADFFGMPVYEYAKQGPRRRTRTNRQRCDERSRP